MIGPGQGPSLQQVRAYGLEVPRNDDTIIPLVPAPLLFVLGDGIGSKPQLLEAREWEWRDSAYRLDPRDLREAVGHGPKEADTGIWSAVAEERRCDMGGQHRAGVAPGLDLRETGEAPHH